MKKLIVFLILTLVAGGFFAVMTIREVNELNTALEAERAAGIVARENLKNSEEKLVVETVVKTAVLQELEVVLQSYTKLEAEFKESIERESRLAERFNEVSIEAETLRATFKEAERQFEFFRQEAERKIAQEYQRGFDEGYRKVNLRNPTLDELKDFLMLDHTNRNLWTINYNCGDFATELNNNAEAVGFRAGFAWIIWEMRQDGKWGHFMNAFELASGEVVFVEPQEDWITKLKVGDSYMGESIKQILIAW